MSTSTLPPRTGKPKLPTSRTLPQACSCKASRWEDAVDAATGTSYVRCLACGRHWVTSMRGWVDWQGLGVLVDGAFVVGSAWTKSVNSRFFGEEWP